MNQQLMSEAIAYGRTKWLRELIRSRLPEILPEQDPNKIKQWDYSIKEFMRERGLVEPRQQKDYWTDIRNAISTFDPSHPALSLVGLTTKQWIKINNSDRDKLQNRTTKLINDPDAVVTKAIALLDSPQWAEITAGLATVTGRRCSELLQTAQFSYHSPYSVIFTGAAKRRTESTPLKFEIPTLAPASKIIDAISRLRELCPTDGLNLKQINQKYEEAVANACHRHFQDLVPTRDGKDNLYTHIFRAVYATIAAHWFCPTTVPVLEFRARIQGHFFLIDETDEIKRHSVATQRHYFDYQIGDGQGNLDGRLGIKLSQPDVQVIAAFQQFHDNDAPDASHSSDSSTSEFLSQDRESTSTAIPHNLVERFNHICDRFNLQADSILTRLELLALHLEQTPTPASEPQLNSLSTDSHAFQQLCASQHLLATALANLTSTQPGSIHTQISPANYTQLINSTQNLSVEPSTPKPPKNSLALAHVNYVIDTVIAYNNHPQRTHRNKWRIGVSLLKRLTTVNQNLIYQVLKQRHHQIEQHHLSHQLSKTHNHKGHSALHLTDVIHIIPYDQFKQRV